VNAPAILVVPDPRLRLRSAPVTDLSSAGALARGMRAALALAGGIGLAAPQVGAPVRLVLVHPDPEAARLGQGDAEALVDPRIVWASVETSTREEGCLSIPGGRWPVTRPARVRVAFRRLDGISAEWEAEGLVAACIQHEIDHLDGRLVIDGLSRTKREMVLRRAAKAARA
jgi:peptide deformylase